jgi:hypothetical protein
MTTHESQETRAVPASRVRRALTIAVVAVGAAFGAPSIVEAQRGGGDGFLFDRPSMSLTVHGGFARANAGSEIFSFTTDLLTLRRGDFDAVNYGADLAIWVSPRFDIVLGAEHAAASRQSEFRDWLDQDELPIQQTTRFERTPVTVGVRGYLLPRGRSIGQFAWVPARVAPYAGASMGAMRYRFLQEGDFVDFDDPELAIFSDRFTSSGWTATAHGVVGFDLSLSPRIALTTEGKYAWAEAEMSQDFVDFDRIDLSGLSGSVGLTFRF